MPDGDLQIVSMQPTNPQAALPAPSSSSLSIVSQQPLPSSQQTTSPTSLIQTVGKTFQEQFQPMAEELHKLNQAAGRGELWQQIKQDFPPTHSVTDTLAQAYGSLNPVSLKYTADGQHVDWPATMAATTGKSAALIGPVFIHMSPEERAQLPDTVKAAIPDVLSEMSKVYQSASDSVRDFALAHPDLTKTAAKVTGATTGAVTGLATAAGVPIPGVGGAGAVGGAITGWKGGGTVATALLDRAATSALRDLGYSDQAIAKMQPLEKTAIIRDKVPASPTLESLRATAPERAATAPEAQAQVQQTIEERRAAARAAFQARTATPPEATPAPAPAEAAPAPTPAPAAPEAATGAPPAAAPTAPATLTEQLKASLAQTPEAAAEKPAAPAPPSTAAPVAPEITNLRNSVESFVESEVPFDQFPALNRRTVAQVDHALSQGDVQKAQKWLDDAYDKMNVSPDELTPEQRQNAMETDDWARTHAAQGRNQYVGKKMLAQRHRVETQPETAGNYRDAVSKFLEQNAPQPVPAAQ
jgi:hypothetical protein